METRGDKVTRTRESKVDLGRELFARDRTAQQPPDAAGDHSKIRVNVTEHGAEVHGIKKGQEISVRVFERGILIQHDE